MNLEEIKRWFALDGGVLIRVDWPDADGKVSQPGADAVATELAFGDRSIGWIFAAEANTAPHAYRVDSVSQFGDELTLKARGAVYQLVVSPLWLPEQKKQLADFRARVTIGDDLKQERDEMIRQADEA